MSGDLWDDWLDDFEDVDLPADDLQRDFQRPEPVADPEAPAPPPADLIRCKQCQSTNIAPRSSDPESTRVQFRCRDCSRTFWIQAPMGYDKAYVLRS